MTLPASLAINFGALTPQGYGGYDLGYNGTGPLTISGSQATGLFAIDTTTNPALEGWMNLVIGASASYIYGANPIAALAALTVPTSYTFTVNSPDQGSCLVTVTVLPNQIFWRPHNLDTGGTNGTQFAKAFYQIPASLTRVAGWAVVQRDGTILDPGGGGYRLRGAGKPDAPAFDPANPIYIAIRPETPKGATITRIQLVGDYGTAGINKWRGFSFEGIIFNWAPPLGTASTSDAMLLTTLGSQYMRVKGCDFIGQSGSLYGGELRGGIANDVLGQAWTVEDCTFNYVSIGINLSNSGVLLDPATWQPLPTDQTTYGSPVGVAHTIRRNVIRNAGLDAIHTANAIGLLLENNDVYDKLASVGVFDANGRALLAGSTAQPVASRTQRLSPFNVTYGQPHGDFWQATYSTCWFGRVAGPIVRGNRHFRGRGRDSLPFWTTTPTTLNADIDNPGGVAYPNPNWINGSSSSVPDPTAAMLDAQCYFLEDNDDGKARAGGAFYPVIVENPIIESNFGLSHTRNSLYLQFVKDPIVRNNTVLSDHLPGSVANASTLQVNGGAAITLGNVSGVGGIVQGNIAEQYAVSLLAGAMIDYGNGPEATSITDGNAVGKNIRIPHDWATAPATFASLFNAPKFSTDMTSGAVANVAFRPKPGSGMEAYGFVDQVGNSRSNIGTRGGNRSYRRRW